MRITSHTRLRGSDIDVAKGRHIHDGADGKCRGQSLHFEREVQRNVGEWWVHRRNARNVVEPRCVQGLPSPPMAVKVRVVQVEQRVYRGAIRQNASKEKMIPGYLPAGDE
jgi:hypothetical protein